VAAWSCSIVASRKQFITTSLRSLTWDLVRLTFMFIPSIKSVTEPSAYMPGVCLCVASLHRLLAVYSRLYKFLVLLYCIVRCCWPIYIISGAI